MDIIEAGHIYGLNWLDGQPPIESNRGIYDNKLIFVNREKGTEHAGTQSQEVIRALIDRTEHCDGCLRWEGNDLIIFHLRMALVLHEARALSRKVEKGILCPELVMTSGDGHFALSSQGK